MTGALVLAACAPDSEPATDPVVSQLPNGAVRVENASRPTASSDAQWRLRRSLVLAGDGRSLEFGRISGFAVDPGGAMVVADGLNHVIVGFRSDGEHAFTAGRQGQGPGEFMILRGIVSDGGEGFWVQDVGNAKYSRFDASGTLMAEVRMEALPIHQPPWGGRALDDGSLIDWKFVTGEVFKYVPFRVSSESNASPSWPAVEHRGDFLPGTQILKPFSDHTFRHIDGDGDLWWVHTRTYELTRRHLSGDTVLIVRRAARPAVVSEEERRRRSESWIRPRRVRLEDIPDHHRVVGAFTTDERGFLYVVPRESDIEMGSVVDVFDPQGIYRQRMRVPTTLEPEFAGIVVSRGFLYSVVRGRAGEEMLARFEIEGHPAHRP